jgi:hypothetical protein
MSSNFKHAVCGAVLALSIAACNTGPEEAEKRPAVKLRVQLDAERNRVWLLTGEGVAIYDASAPDKVLRIQLPGWQFAGAPNGCLPDLALGSKGEAVVSSDVAPVLWRVDPETLAVTRHAPKLDADTNKDVGFTILRYLPKGGAYLAVSGRHGTIWRIDGGLRTAHRMVRQVPRENDCGARAATLMRHLAVRFQ